MTPVTVTLSPRRPFAAIDAEARSILVAGLGRTDDLDVIDRLVSLAAETGVAVVFESPGRAIRGEMMGRLRARGLDPRPDQETAT